MENKLPVVFVGLRFGRVLLDRVMRGEEGGAVRVVGVCDLDLALARRVGSELSLKVYESLDAVLADPAIPAVVLLTPPGGRAELVRRCISAGKDVMTTKPFERDSAAAAAVLSEARRAGRVVHVNSPNPASPDLAVIGNWIREHDLGRPVAARVEMLASVREEADGTWYDDPRRCPLAPMFRIGIYAINDVVRLFGPARQVFAQGERLRTGRPTPDQAQLAISFHGGGMASVLASFCCDDGSSYLNSLLLHCERGTIHRNLDPAMPWLAPDDYTARLSLVKADGASRRVIEVREAIGRSGAYLWDEFAAAVRQRRPLGEADCAVIVNGLRVVEAMAESERTGAAVKL
ncbi:MAG TPA: Gfo/Idh/MocA family oxidoreductase [Opitutaceae bacterium]|nr:Gfo/Idh/MocA family oxidoreductase [Opitutaceae bacterium]